MSVIDNYTVQLIKVAPHCSIEIIFLHLQSLFSHNPIFYVFESFIFFMSSHIKTCF